MFFLDVLVSNYYISILKLLLHTVSLIKKYVDISYKLDIPPGPIARYEKQNVFFFLLLDLHLLQS